MPWMVLLIYMLFQPAVNAEVNSKRCAKVKAKIAKVEQKMRRGYNVKQGEKLKKKLRELKQLRYQCMKKRLPTS